MNQKYIDRVVEIDKIILGLVRRKEVLKIYDINGEKYIDMTDNMIKKFQIEKENILSGKQEEIDRLIEIRKKAMFLDKIKIDFQILNVKNKKLIKK